MRERSRDKGRLEDMRQYALNVEKILEGVTYSDFVEDSVATMYTLQMTKKVWRSS